MSARQSQTAWFHCFAGIAGDMALGSLLDAGAPVDEVQGLLSTLPINGWTLVAEPVLRGGIAATHAVVKVDDDGVVRTYPNIVAIVSEASLPARVKERSLAIFASLAEVEGRLHRRPPSQVHFHEVGGHDAIIDVVGTAIALELLDIDNIVTSPVATGHGFVHTQHGVLPNPAPAVLALLEDVPVWGRDIDLELTTPTGAAIVASLSSSFGPLPAMSLTATGYGAGTREIEGMVNCTQVVIGTALSPLGRASSIGGSPLVVLEANLDDATGEQLGETIASLMEHGALDAWVIPVTMKKGRPGHLVAALVEVSQVDSIRERLVHETGSLGVRAHTVDRWSASRRIDEVVVEGHTIRVKVTDERVKAEHDDAVSAARSLGMPIREVISRAEQAWRELELGSNPLRIS